MGYFAKQQTDILEFYEEGLSPKAISRFTGAPLEVVLETISEFEDGEFEPSEPNDSFADAEALASAGFGTDEDYGYYGEE